MYSTITFLSAFLLFGLQPLLGRAILPIFGGGAGIWIACMMFFQIILLAGYGYAHGVVMRLPARHVLRLHSGFLVASLLLLLLSWYWSGAPFLPSWQVPGAQISSPPLAICVVLSLTASLPMMALSTTSPLIQAIYRHAEGKDPYRLYAISNVGSLCGLLTYPLLLEPLAGLHVQAFLFSALFAGYGLLTFMLMKGKLPREGYLSTTEVVAGDPAPPGATAGFSLPLRWVGLSALGCIWLLSISNYLSTLVASMPFLWIPPLALYLGTFIWAFEGKRNPRAPWLQVLAVGLLLLFTFAAAALYTFGPLAELLAPLIPGIDKALISLFKAYNQPLLPRIILSLLVLFFSCLMIHGRLKELRPEPNRLTSYFLWISFGGVLGGLFVGLIAPMIFNQDYELGLAMVLTAALFTAGYWTARPGRNWKGWAPASLALIFGLTALGSRMMNAEQSSRDFFGITTVIRPHPNVLTMTHGMTRHGLEITKQPLLPVAYYGETSGFGRVIRHLQATRPSLNVGVVGLGVGNSVAFGRPADRFTFFEISPKVIELAGRQGTVFSVLRSSPSRVQVLEGDGRHLLEQQIDRDEPFDLILVDAFAGGHIPTHLLTREALDIYLRRLKPDGMLVLHVSHHLPLQWVAAAGLRELGVFSLLLHAKPQVIGKDSRGKTLQLEYTSTFWASSRSADLLAARDLVDPCIGILTPSAFRSPLRPEDATKHSLATAFSKKVRPWSDERNSLTDLLLLSWRH